MKIQKAIFSVSEPPEYSSFWNTQSKLYRVGLGIEPVCLLWGKKANTNMCEEYGRVIEMEPLPDIPWGIQMFWSKFDFTRTEPETTWIIGDMDLLPLSKHHFVDNIVGVPDEDYAHLNAAGISSPRLGFDNGFLEQGSERHARDRGWPASGGPPGADLPAHYHVAKGKHFERIYFAGKTFKEMVEFFIESKRWGMGVNTGLDEAFRQKNPTWYYWVVDENYTSFTLWNAIKAGQVNYHSFTYHNSLQRLFPWDKERQDYVYNRELLANRGIVDIHCCQVRPYALQAEALERVIDVSGILR